MSGSGKFWAMSNAQSCDLLVWVEPWAEEFRVPKRSVIAFEIISPPSQNAFPEVAIENEYVVVWANGGDLIRVSIDGTLQYSASAEIVVPDIPNLSPKHFLQTAFQGQSAARLGGQAAEAAPDNSILRGLRNWLRR